MRKINYKREKLSHYLDQRDSVIVVWNVINANVSYLRTLILKTEAGRRNHGRQLLAET